MKTINIKNHNEQGAASIIIVLFTMLLITIVTVGFIQIMLRNQQEASTVDQSQAAYDASIDGVEDAKLALQYAQKCKIDPIPNPLNDVFCSRLTTALDAEKCDTLRRAFDNDSGERVIGGAGVIDASADQAYTCVKVKQNTPNYKRHGLMAGHSHLVPLRVAPGASFDRIEIKWFLQKDVNDGRDSPALSYPSIPVIKLPEGTSEWGEATAPLLRTQLMQTGSSFSLPDFDAPTGGMSDADTLFMYPSNGGVSTADFAADSHQGGSNAPTPIRCDATSFSSGGYACTVTVSLRAPIGGDALSRQAFLRLSALYNITSYQLTLLSGVTAVDFYSVQPEVDSTGRAGDVFRRVQARVELRTTDFPYPENAVQIEGNLCKNFWVTNNVAHYNDGLCTVDPTS